jgi:ATP-dependent DNA helicase RecG
MLLGDPVHDHFRLAEEQKRALHKLGILTISDLLYHFPVRYGDTSKTQSIQSLQKGIPSVVFGKISGLKMSKGFKSKIPMATATVSDESGSIELVWFNQPYIAKMLAENSFVRIEGAPSERKKTGQLYFSNPKAEQVASLPTGVGDSLFGDTGPDHTLYPVYPESKGITSNWIYHAIVKIFKYKVLETLADPIPADILKKYSLPTLASALVWIHTPMKEEDALAARKRFAFEEVFFIQIEKQKARKEYASHPGFEIEPPEKHIQEFIKRFPFEATDAQKKAIDTIVADFKKGIPMSRLLEGDVGSGKTAVAAATTYAVVNTRPKGQDYGRLQVAYMCPTEILATQHFESFIQYFAYMLGMSIGLMTSSGCKKFPSKLNPKGWTDISRTQLLKWVENGEIPILIGTHSLIQKSVKFKNLAYVIIDEQHRFGSNQRAKLVRKDNIAPHLLSMSATPIPRTLALTVFGDLDLTLLDAMPAGRKPIITEIVSPDKREKTYEHIRGQLAEGRQAYVICPYIDDNEKSVIAEAARLKKDVFKEYEVGILHGKMTPKAKDKAMLDFKGGKTHILCATSVVEVGVNVPNANVIIIEGGERFGLAQLHQLRGRVIRGTHQAYCYVFTDSGSEKTAERLKALSTAKNGFELAENDLQLRGSGVLYSGKQWGISDVGMEALMNIKMVEAARTEAGNILPTLDQYPLILKELDKRSGEKIHFE